MLSGRYLALGDNLTQGWGDPGADGRLVGWAVRFAGLHEATGASLALTNLATRAGRSVQHQPTNGQRHSPPARRGHAPTWPLPDQADDAIRLYDIGWSLARIGEHLSVDPTIVLNQLRERGIPRRAGQVRMSTFSASRLAMAR